MIVVKPMERLVINLFPFPGSFRFLVCPGNVVPDSSNHKCYPCVDKYEGE